MLEDWLENYGVQRYSWKPNRSRKIIGFGATFIVDEWTVAGHHRLIVAGRDPRVMRSLISRWPESGIRVLMARQEVLEPYLFSLPGKPQVRVFQILAGMEKRKEQKKR